MSNDKNHRRGFATLCVTAALAVMALSAPAAQAAPPEWMVEGANISANLQVNSISSEIEAINFENTQKRVLVLLAETLGLWFTCEEVFAERVTLMAGGTGSGEATFASCKTLTRIGGVMTLNATCAPAQPIPIAYNFSIALHGTPSRPYVKLTGANAGGEFTTITIPNEACVFEGAYKVKGTFWMEDCTNAFETERLTHLVKEGAMAASALGGLTVGGAAATFDGSLNLQLWLTNQKEFSGLAN